MFWRRDRRDKADDLDDVREAAVGEEFDDVEAAEDQEGSEDQPEDMTADLDSQAADYLAGNDVWMYGPNAEAVLEILDRLEDIVPDEARPLSEAWLAIPKSDREQARRAARKIAEEDEELARYLQLAREAVGTWMAVTGPYPEFVNADPDWSRLCSQSGEAALDAATAVILEGKLEESQYEDLLEPWSETMADLDAAADAAKVEGADAGKPARDDDAEAGNEADEGEGKFGPNSDAVTDFLNRLWLLSPEQVGLLVNAWQEVDRKELKSAHDDLRSLVDEDPEWRDQVRRAQEELAPWLNAGRIEETSGFLGQTGQSDSRKMAGPALADAVAALVFGDLLDRRAAKTLYGPWFNLVGSPHLPVASAKESKGGGKAPASSSPSSRKVATGGKTTIGGKSAKPAGKTAKPAGKTAKPAGKAAKK